MEYGLSVLEKSRGWQASGEYRAGDKSWKYKLAQDIAECLKTSFNQQDFQHRLNDMGLDADFGRKNVMFFVRKDGAMRYGLSKEMSCGNDKLMSYGDFSKENIENAWKSNEALAGLGWRDVDVLQDVLREVGQLLSPENPNMLEQMYLADINFEGMTKLEIEIALARRMAKIKAHKAMQEYEAAARNKPNLVLPCLDALVSEIIKLCNEQQQADNAYSYAYDDENEYEI